MRVNENILKISIYHQLKLEFSKFYCNGVKFTNIKFYRIFLFFLPEIYTILYETQITRTPKKEKGEEDLKSIIPELDL